MHPSRNLALMEAFAVELKTRRRALGISQEELALRSKVNRTFVARMESGQNQPSLSVLFLLCEGLKIKPEELMVSIHQRMAGK